MRLVRVLVLVSCVLAAIVTRPTAAAGKESRDQTARALQVNAAFEFGGESEVVRLFDEKPKPDAYGSNLRAYWLLATSLEHAGRYAAARDFYARLAVDRGDPDAIWGLRRCVLAMGPDKASSQARALASEYPQLELVLQALLLGPPEDAALDRRIDTGVALANKRDDGFSGAALRLLRGDLAMKRNDGDAALQSYIYVGYDHKVPAVHVREAAMFGLLDRWGDAQYSLGKLPQLTGDDGFVSPSADSARAQVEAGIAAWQRRVFTRDSLAHEVAYAAAPPPAGLDWGTALKAGMPTPPAEVNGSYGVEWNWDLDRWRVSWNPEQRLLVGQLSFAGASSLDLERLRFVRLLDQDSMRVSWQPARQAYVFRSRSGDPDDSMSAILFADGDLFVGFDDAPGRGLYLSPGQPPFDGRCFFGRSPAAAQRVVQVLEEGSEEGPERSLHVLLADSAEFIGTGVIENGVLFATAHGRIRYPRRGTFFGQFKGGIPSYGFLADPQGTFFLLRGPDATYRYARKDYAGKKLDFNMHTLETGITMQVLENGLLEFCDGVTGLLLTFDPATGQYDERFDEARQELHRINLKFAQLDKERAERGAEIQARVEASNKAADEAAALERVRSGPSTFQFSAPRRNDRCIHCKGAGQIYVGSSVTQGYRYDENNKTMVDSNLHVSGHMEVCHWCNGTGKR